MKIEKSILLYTLGIILTLPGATSFTWGQTQHPVPAEAPRILDPKIPAAANQEAGAPPETRPCKPEQDDRRSDLCAQWKSADAAKVSADAAVSMFWLTLAGTVSGFLTLLAAAAAAWYARAASLAATRAAESAVNSVNIANLNTRALLNSERARLYPIIVTWNLPDLLARSTSNAPSAMSIVRLTVNYHLENYGRTPAKILSIKHAVQPVSHDRPSMAPQVHESQPNMFIRGGDKSDLLLGCTYDESEAKIASYRLHKFVKFQGVIEYEDVMGVHYRASFEFRTAFASSQLRLISYEEAVVSKVENTVGAEVRS